MIDWGKLYDEFLYDCYIANQHLAEEDWHYYGREEHHIEIPNRDGGSLTPLNSQYLTTYQHWVAGVLQSEVLGKCCFAMVPRNVLSPHLEILRKKYLSQTKEQLSGNGKKSHLNRTPESYSEAVCKGNMARTPDQRSESAKQRWATVPVEERSAHGQKAWKCKTPEERSEIVRRARAKLTPEERSAAAVRAWETRRRKKQDG